MHEIAAQKSGKQTKTASRHLGAGLHGARKRRRAAVEDAEKLQHGTPTPVF